MDYEKMAAAMSSDFKKKIHDERARPQIRKPIMRTHWFRILLLALLSATVVWALVPESRVPWRFTKSFRRPIADSADSEWILVEETSVTRPTLEIGIMSKCPDAKDCLEKLIVPTMSKVADKVHFNMSFIGRIDPRSDGISCMHGPSECLGNIILLCAAKLYPSPKLYLGFTNCMISDYKDIPERHLVEGCANEHGMDFKSINACISDEGEGIDLLRASVQQSTDANVTKSCTILLDGELRCIRDGGRWKDCDEGSSVKSLVKNIEDLYNKKNA